MLNITKGQILYVISQNGTKIKPAKVIDIIKNCDESIDPDWYMDVVTKYLDSKTNGTVTFRPKDFGVIIFDSEQKAKSEMNKKQNEPIKKAKLTAENVKIICHKCLSSEKNQNIKHIECISGTYVFSLEALEEYKTDITDMTMQLPDEFMQTKGGGASFLRACLNNNNEQWGEQIDAQTLIALGLAINKIKKLTPDCVTPMLPGRVPYYVIIDN